MRYLLDYPKLISVPIENNAKEIFELFDIYLKIGREGVISIFKSFPYLFCLQAVKVQKFLGLFKMYKFKDDEVIKVLTQCGSVMGMRVNTMFGLFDNLNKLYGIEASQVKQIIMAYPEFIYQNKSHLLFKKLELI
mmetsp:Transcript_14071/g.10131  ORF Transcript_14071/g.10131 Transcript_14071/m.10131 type:complete len:135 (+) Transcript_14071:233-637(+)|eukprot:CAMPEP_0202963790 /NCGR_PEP_ID=MMETSP1396-20130829/7808_1 /ASSEMBLY_ACC=CAM_ASM_000872 /TAXON_ID= /ORGANISM="Pseudokeronopsis sp., Strain Brazil" /LENGTH=134 /DNA_ID=CAMNT_0049685305 /DNA_START=678 /DNA_END=1082 /DNA_ORIENTATION=-